MYFVVGTLSTPAVSNSSDGGEQCFSGVLQSLPCGQTAGGGRWRRKVDAHRHRM